MRAVSMGADRAAYRRLLRFASGILTAVICATLAASAGIAAEKRPADDIWTRETLTGDWGGPRSRLEDKGVTFSFEYISELLANLHGGIKRGEAGLGRFIPQMDVDLDKVAGWGGASFRLSGVITHGPAFSPTFVGNLLVVSNIELPRPVARVYEAWYQQTAFNERFSVRAGLLLADTEFGTSDTASAFMQSTLGWMGWLANDLPFGGPAYPLSTPGARVKVKPADDVYLQAAVFSGDPTGGDGSNQGGPFPQGTVASFRGGAFLMAEAGFTPNQKEGAVGLPGAYKLGAWYHTSSRFGDQRFDNTGLSLADPMSTGIPLDHTGNWGIYAVADQMFFRVPGTEDQGLSAFVRIGAATPNDRNLVSFYIDGGLVYKGLIPGRPDDKVGIAAAHARIGRNARNLDRDTAFFSGEFYPVRSNETVVELTYQAKLAPWWTLQPDLQYVIRPSGGVLNDDGSLRRNAWVASLRSVVNF
jgi:porin